MKKNFKKIFVLVIVFVVILYIVNEIQYARHKQDMQILIKNEYSKFIEEFKNNQEKYNVNRCLP